MIQIHLRKCFDSIAELDFVSNGGNDSSCSIRGMISTERERVEFVAVSYPSIFNLIQLNLGQLIEITLISPFKRVDQSRVGWPKWMHRSGKP